MAVRQEQIRGEPVFSVRPPNLGVLYCGMVSDSHPNAQDACSHLENVAAASVGGHVGAPFTGGLVKIGILDIELFLT